MCFLWWAQALNPEQIVQQLKQELLINERIAKLLREHARNSADQIYRKAGTTSDHATLIRLTGSASAIEDFIEKLLTLRTETR